MFWPPIFFFGGGAPPEFLKSIYKIRLDSDHVAKFQADRSRDLGESVAKKRKKKTSAVKHKPVRNGGSGRPNNNNNNLIYIAPACQMTSKALADSSSCATECLMEK